MESVVLRPSKCELLTTILYFCVGLLPPLPQAVTQSNHFFQCSSMLASNLCISRPTLHFSNFCLGLCLDCLFSQKSDANPSIFINSWYAKSSKGPPVDLTWMLTDIRSAFPTIGSSGRSTTHWTWFKSEVPHISGCVFRQVPLRL